MRVYHRTDAADAILANGFRDATGIYLTRNEWTGVWFSDVPLDSNEGLLGQTLLAVEIPEALFERYEWFEEGKGYREALIPAALVNQHAPIQVIDEP